MSGRIVRVSDSGVIRQNEDGLQVILDESIELGMLKDEVAFGLLPVGTVMALMPYMAGSFQPDASGIVKDGYQICDGAAIPSGNTLIGTTPDINNSSYLRGSASSSGIPVSSNTRSLNAPEIALHGHPVTIAADATPHNHTVTIGTVDTPHAHSNTITTADAPHAHPASDTDTANIPHIHPATESGATNAPHTHPGATGTGGPHTHPISASAPGSNSHNHGIYVTWTPPGPAIRRDYNGTLSGSASYRNMSFSQPSGVTNHAHPDPISAASNAPHKHPASTGATNVPHTHPISTWAVANAPHGHPTTTGPTTFSHQHPLTISTQLTLHSHTTTANPTATPHNHPGTITGNTGLGDALSFEPNYFTAVYIIRVR